jgi:heterodisulfide reductase subunit B
MTEHDGRTYTYYPGCSQQATNRAYDISTRSLARALGLELIELEDWNCCGATAYVAIEEKRAFVLSARNLALAEKTGRRDLVTACNGCYLALNKTGHYMAADAGLQKRIQGALEKGGMRYDGGIRVRHFLEVVLNNVGEKAVRQRVERPLGGLRVAPYYGCQMTRPFGEIDDPEFPVKLDHLVRWLGAEPAPFPLKAKCCGGLMMTTQPEIGLRLTGKVLKSAKEQGADCIITCCPLCQMNLEAYQKSVSAAMACDCATPVLYFTQLMGYAFGLSAKELALRDSLTPVIPMLSGKVAIA